MEELSITQMIEKVDKVMEELKGVLREFKEKERLISKLQSKIITLENKRGEIEKSLAQGEAEFLATQRKKGEDIIAEAIKKAETKTASILAPIRAEESDLKAKVETLKKRMGDLDALYLKRSAEVNDSIKELEGKRGTLEGEIAVAVKTRDSLQVQISSFKERISSI